MPVYTGDYQRDTRHLSCSEHGIYFQLLMHCWDQKGPLPLDERRVCGIVNARSGDEIEALRRVLDEFFTRMDDGWYNKRMQSEIERAEALSDKKSRAGRMGYQAMSKHLTEKRIQARAKQVLGTCPADASTPTPTLTPTPTPTPKDLRLSHSVDASASPAVDAPACPVDRIVALWNQIVAPAGGKKVLNVSRTRRAMIACRWREVGPESVDDGLHFFTAFFRDRIAPSKFATGRQPDKDGRSFRIGIDSALRSEQVVDQILEGKYA